MKFLHKPDLPFDATPPSYREISKIIHKMKSSGSACPFDHVNAIALKRFPILRSFIVGLKTSFQPLGEKVSACLYTKKVHQKSHPTSDL